MRYGNIEIKVIGLKKQCRKLSALCNNIIRITQEKKKPKEVELGIRIAVDLDTNSAESVEGLFDGIMEYANNHGYYIKSGSLNCERFFDTHTGFKNLDTIYSKQEEWYSANNK